MNKEALKLLDHLSKNNCKTQDAISKISLKEVVDLKLSSSQIRVLLALQKAIKENKLLDLLLTQEEKKDAE